MSSAGPSRRECFRILGLEESATPQEIRQAYRRLAREHHPDRHGGSEEATQRFIEIAIAYTRLKVEFRITKSREKAVPPHEMTMSPTVAIPRRRRARSTHTRLALALFGATIVGVVLIAFSLSGPPHPLVVPHQKSQLPDGKAAGRQARRQYERDAVLIGLSDAGASASQPAPIVPVVESAKAEDAWSDLSRFALESLNSERRHPSLQQDVPLDVAVSSQFGSSGHTQSEWDAASDRYAGISDIQTFLGGCLGVTVIEAKPVGKGFCVAVVFEGTREDVSFSDASLAVNYREAAAWYATVKARSSQPASAPLP
jgi:hypothetical protein